ncbi:MAG: glycosyltransferase 87 family protein, partial [Desulfobacteraceae bacterium]|nr:glycosyltransferase 87 family protein [Desulfobacteraceae bacterium]
MEQPDHRIKKSFDSRAVFAAIVGLASVSAAIYGINFKIFDLVPVFSGLFRIQLYVIMFLFLSVLYFIAVFLVIKFMDRSDPLWKLTGIIIFFFAIIFRLCLVPSDPSVLSRDMYRYIWDGRVQQDGINPYRYPPQADELEHLRENQIYPKINRKDYPTLYPAGAQIFFRLFYALVGSNVTAYKGIMVFFDIVTLLVLTALLRAYDFNASRIIVYAWNPLVIFEIAYSGHLEGLTVFLMVTALYLYTIHQKTPATMMLALSAAVKLYPALLLAAFLNRGTRIKGITTFSATIIFLYLPFWGAGGKISGFLPVYLKNPYESFNLGLKNLLMRLIPSLDYYLLSLVFIIALAGAGLLILLKEKKDLDVMRYAFILVGLLMILMPASLHPWYVVLIVPFLAIYP